MSVPEDRLLSPRVESTSDKGTNWFGYKYLGPGTDVHHHVSQDVKAVDDLDAQARKHDIVYSNIRHMYEKGELSHADALKLVDKADWTLANRAAVSSVKNLISPGFVKDLAMFNPNVFKRLAKSVPGLYTSAVMRLKWIGSKLGIGRGLFAGLKKGKSRSKFAKAAPSKGKRVRR